MATTTDIRQGTGAPTASTRPTRHAPSARLAALPLGIGGLLIAAGGQLHPHGSGATVDSYLASMLGSGTWLPSHLLLLLGTALATVGFVTTRRAEVFGPRVEGWLVTAAIGWGVATVELVPHLVAVRDADGLAHHHATPVLDLHLSLQVAATPLMGLTGAALAIAVAWSARTVPAWLLAVPAVVGGIGYAASAPLIAATGSLAPTVLFPMQAGLAVWLVGTWLRVQLGRSRAAQEATR
ncbi:MAG TPA: hypothetical protein VFL10_03950 [Ornithinibacter sp.]|nr:hypothetical protein [Ornithinibacter sp.]